MRVRVLEAENAAARDEIAAASVFLQQAQAEAAALRGDSSRCYIKSKCNDTDVNSIPGSFAGFRPPSSAASSRQLAAGGNGTAATHLGAADAPAGVRQQRAAETLRAEALAAENLEVSQQIVALDGDLRAMQVMHLCMAEATPPHFPCRSVAVGEFRT